MPSGKRALGRGLADLIPVGGGATAADAHLPTQAAPLAALHPNPHQPRTQFDDPPLAELAESIKANGILQPILVRPRPAGGFEIVAGERRYRAARRAGLTEVPIVVRNLSDEEALALALVENLLREDISPLETARAFRRLIDEFGLTQEDLSRRVGKSRAAVANTLRLLELPSPLLESLGRGEITEGHARALLARDASPALQKKVWQMIRQRGLSVREVERLMKSGLAAASEAPVRSARLSTELGALEDRLRAAIALRVRIVGSQQRGRVEIEYNSEQELDDLIARWVDPHVAEDSPAPHRSGRGSGPIEGLLRSRRPA